MNRAPPGASAGRSRAPTTALLGTLLTLLAALAATGQALADPLSGLPWPSGAKDGLGCLAQLRGRAIDVQHFHVLGPDFPSLVSGAGGWVSRSIAAGPPMTLASFALLPTGNKGQFAACAAGQFDGYWRQIGAALKAAAGTTKAVFVEPGWEANLGSGTHPWGVDDASQVADYRACFQHAATALRSAFPGAIIMWSNTKRYFKDYTVDQMNP